MTVHAHSGACEHTRSRNQRRLALTLLLSAVYMVAEIVGGLAANSLALLADAGHMLSDVAALALSLFALWIAARPSRPRQTYGYYRAEILASLANGALLIAITAYILIESWERLRSPPAVAGGVVTVIAVGGLIVNGAGLALLHGGREDSLNLRGAWLHTLSDALGSVGALAAGILIWLFGWTWADPIASMLIGLLIIYSAWHLTAESVTVLMEHAPRGVDIDGVRDAIMGVESVQAVHDLHVWTISSGMVSLSAHVVTAGRQADHKVLHQVRETLHERFGIVHVTIQMEPEGFVEREAPFCRQSKKSASTEC